MRRASLLVLGLFLLGSVSSLRAADPPDFKPDPLSVKRHGAGYRYPQAGWIVLHIEGDPYERGYQHGQLLAPEIAGYLKCFASLQNSKAPADGWKTVRTMVNALFVRKFDKEFLTEMKGIADGAAAAGAKFDDRPVDLIDIVGINCWAEIETLDAALEATPTGLEGIKFPKGQPKVMPAPKPMHCSAFAATGPATKDGKVVFGHVTMFDLYPSLFYNVWLDVQPKGGNRIVMQTYPGGIQSGMDYYINSAGILMLETTIAQTRFDINGLTTASRTRKAMQYATTIDQAVELLRKDGNGLYTNEWLFADIKTNEIAMFELGTTKSKLWRSSKNEWYGNTPGFYWGCNNAKDLQVRLDTVATVEGKPANMIWKPADRDIRWQELYAKHAKTIDAEFGKTAFQTHPLCSSITIDAKFTTTDLAKQMKSWALFGPPLGKSWQPSDDEKKTFPDIRPLVSNPWTILHPTPPAKDDNKGVNIVDLPDKIEDASTGDKEDKKQSLLRTEDRTILKDPAWHGTILPKTDADLWLAIAFADYQKIVALENTLTEQAKDNKLTASDRERLGLELYTERSDFMAAARIKGDTPLAKIRFETGSANWYRIASGKGVLALNELRDRVGAETFTRIMDSFGRKHAGKEVSIADFQAHVSSMTKEKGIPELFAAWTQSVELPRLELGPVTSKKQGEHYHIDVEVSRTRAGGLVLPVEITVETEKGEVTKKFSLESPKQTFRLESEDEPKRVVVDKYGTTAKANGGTYSVLSFKEEPEQTLIVYGTADDEAANKETAEALQEAIRTSWCNCTVKVKSDTEIVDAELKGNHILFIGRLDSNKALKKLAPALPVTFGHHSFVVHNEAYANMGSAVIAAAENPLNKRYSIVVLAGLSAEATTKLPPVLLKKDQTQAELFVLASGSAKARVVPARELVRELAGK